MEAHRNPTKSAVRRLLGRARGGALRVAKDHATGDLYVWDAAIATHRQMIDHLRLPMADGAGFLWQPGDLDRLTH